MITITSAGPDSEPITLEDAKNYLRITHSLDDDAVYAYIKAARVAFERFSGRLLMTQVCTQTMDAFPCGNKLHLLKGPVQSVTRITALNAASEGTDLDPDQYVIDPAGQRVVLKSDVTWPAVEQVAAGAQVVYTAGYADATAVPSSILQGMRHLMAHFHENRETSDAIPPVVEALWSPFKVLVI